MLLSDPKFVQFASTEVVTSWEKVRDVPKVTINFGNGKTLTRTLKGNTVLYLCTPDGRIVDAWPGVYTPQFFLPEARAAIAVAKQGEAALDAFHANQAKLTLLPDSMAITLSKSMVEAPLLEALGYRRPAVAAQRAHPLDTHLDPFGLSMPTSDSKARYNRAFWDVSKRIRDLSETPMSAHAAQSVVTHGAGDTVTPEQAGREAVQADTVQNRKFVRPLVQIWLASMTSRPTPDEARDIMFKQVLHVPIDDPYLGLGVVVPGTPAH